MPEAEIDPGTLINNRYQIERVIGQGGFGRTYLASDEQRFGELCVLKEFVPSTRAEYTVQKSRVLFETEAKVLYQINHPQIPEFLACFTEMGRLFIVQEYIDGKTYSELLRERQQQGQLFSEAEVIQWLRDLLPVLTYLHERNIVHRDISPDNVMLPNYQTQPMLIDFGLVKQKVTQIWAANSNSSSLTGQSSFVGKFGYAPIEQIRMGQCYPCSDLYALGATAVVLLTGKEPNSLVDRGTLEWKWHDYVKVSDQLGRTLDKMLKEKPKDRYQSALEVQASLQAIASPGVIVPTPLMELDIEIDQNKKDRQVAEFVEMEFFQQLERQAEEIRNSTEDPVSQPETRTEQSTISTETIVSSPPEPPVLKLIHSSGREFRLQGQECYIGRQGQSSGRQGQSSRNVQKIDLTGIPNEGVVSRTHARIYWDWSQNAYMLVDNNSRNGTCLNGNPLPPGVHYPLNHGDSLQLDQNNSVCFTVSVTWLEAKPQLSVRLEEMAVSLPSGAVNPESQLEPVTPPKLNPVFIDRCRQELALYIGPIARYILEEILAEHPNISAPQLVEALAAEIPNPQQAIKFRQRLSL